MELPEPPWRTPRRKPRQQLSRQAIVDAALAILDAEGLDAVSMRRVAQALNTGPASLYAHVSSKEELCELLLERVLSQVRVPTPDPARWREQLKELCKRQVGALVEHPGIARIALDTLIPATEHSFVLAEAMLGLMRAGGVPDRLVAIGFDVLSLYCTAFAVEVNAVRSGEVSPEQLRERGEQMGRYVAALPPDRFPALLAMGHLLGEGDGEQRFDAALDLIIGGLANQDRT
ncbi:TetR/AcrR family transcriptional regulator [Kutzneria albida]|uniref:HTH tetR-type domain-containing protein n=1 Tax=Kutzneria albida DSM 43870 TaxID=1449976 RepID=W5WG52_9PSEU|nr:TetR/AcrR family transcriptional regulator [Kutzneria albida]AHH99725.1 hypothetical protein KALB_6365 [Kutzneria albida DSM 43870]